MNILNKIGTCPLPLRSVGNLQYPPHGREYEDCKQILKLSLNPTHTYNARQDFSQHSCQKTCPMGRAESDYCLSASASSSIKPKILNYNNIPAFGQDILYPHLDLKKHYLCGMLSKILKDIPHKIKQFPAKTILLEAGDVATNIFIVKSGCIRSWYNADGDDITLQFFMPEQPVASFESLVNSTPSEYSIETLLPTEVVVVNGLDFKNWIESHPEYHLQGIHFAMERLSSYQKLFLSRIKDTPQQRYEALLKEQPDIVAQIPQHYIASYLGITPVSLSRIRSRICHFDQA